MYNTKPEENRDGEIIQNKLIGLFYCSSKIVMRLHTWLASKVTATNHEAKIDSVAPNVLNEFDPVFSFAPEGHTWSCVNNCMGVIAGGALDSILWNRCKVGLCPKS